MTFKHIDFGSSETMRSLERLAQEKGLIKNNPLEKIASSPPKSKKVNLTPTNNLSENLMKLCCGLRESGLNKYAEEIESTFIRYKRAENLYETSKEEGEDLVNAAHPNGSHKLEGVDSVESVIETIIDQHLKIMKAVEKKPTGKLSSRNIINLVKIALESINWNEPAIPEDINDPVALSSWRTYKILSELQKIKIIVNNLDEQYKNFKSEKFISGKYSMFGLFFTNIIEINEDISKLNTKNLNKDGIDDIITDLQDIINVINYKLELKNETNTDMLDLYKNIKIKIKEAINIANEAKEIMFGKNDKDIKEMIIKRKEEIDLNKKKYESLKPINILTTKINKIIGDIKKYISSWENILKTYKLSLDESKYISNILIPHFNGKIEEFEKIKSNIDIYIDISKGMQSGEPRYDPSKFSLFVKKTLMYGNIYTIDIIKYSHINTENEFDEAINNMMNELKSRNQTVLSYIEK